MVYKCSVCGENVEDNLLVYINHTEKHIVDEIQANHPEWLKEDGICEKCVEYYRKQLHGDSLPEQ